MFFKNASGTNYNAAYLNYYGNQNPAAFTNNTSTATIDLKMHAAGTGNLYKSQFTADIGTKGDFVHMFYKGFHLGVPDSYTTSFVTIDYNSSNPLRKIRLMPTGGDFAAGCQFLLYKWNET